MDTEWLQEMFLSFTQYTPFQLLLDPARLDEGSGTKETLRRNNANIKSVECCSLTQNMSEQGQDQLVKCDEPSLKNEHASYVRRRLKHLN